jgi:hypothetical protein
MILYLHHLEKLISTFNTEYMLNSWKVAVKDLVKEIKVDINWHIYTRIFFNIV